MDKLNYSPEGVDSWKTIILLYNSALKEVGTKLEILNDEFQHVHQYNPIEHIKSRIKTPESIVKKLKRRIADMLAKQSDIKVLSIKDYIRNPKESGYKSYHMIVTVPIFLSDGSKEAKVEIQIRTVAMDFWASLEHKINYKYEGDVPEHIKRELLECAEMVSDLDAKMLSLNEEIKDGEEDEDVVGGLRLVR